MLQSGLGTARSAFYGKRNIWLLDLVLVLAIYSFYINYTEIAVRNMIFLLPSRPLANGILSPFTNPPISQILYTFLQKRGERMAYPDPIVCLQNNIDMASSQSEWFLFEG